MGFIFSDSLNNIIVGALTVVAAVIPIIPQLVRQSDYQDVFYEYRGNGRILIHRLSVIAKFAGWTLYLLWSLPILRGIIFSLISSNELDFLGSDSVFIYATLLIAVQLVCTYTLIYWWFRTVRSAAVKRGDGSIKIIDSTWNRLFALTVMIIVGVMILLLYRSIFPGTYYQFVYLMVVGILTIIFTFYAALAHFFTNYLRYKVDDVVIMLDGEKTIRPKEYIGDYHGTMIVIDENGQHLQINVDKIMCVYRNGERK